MDGETNLKNFIQNSTTNSTGMSSFCLVCSDIYPSYSRLSAVLLLLFFAEVYKIVTGAQFYTFNKGAIHDAVLFFHAARIYKR